MQLVIRLDRHTVSWDEKWATDIFPKRTLAGEYTDTNLKYKFKYKSYIRYIIHITVLRLRYTVAARRLWNELPSDIRKASTLATFKNILRHSYSANTMTLSWNSNNTAMFFVVLLLFSILICFYHIYCTLLSLSIVLLHVCTWLVSPAVSRSV